MPPSVRLVHLTGGRRGAVDELPAAGALIGRDPTQCHVLVAETDDSVSRVHAHVFPHQGGWWVVDRGSRTGTTVDGVQAREPVRLAVGGSLQLGPSVTLQLTEATAAGDGPGRRTTAAAGATILALSLVAVLLALGVRQALLPARESVALPDRAAEVSSLDGMKSGRAALEEPAFPRAVRRLISDLSGEPYVCPIPDLFLEDVQDELVAMYRARKDRCRMLQWRPHLMQVLVDEAQTSGQPPSRAAALVYLPWVESNYTPVSACSVAGARGMWQFMPPTARRYGLAVTDGYDARCHWVDATRAAMRYFGDIFTRCGADHPLLAIAGYNTGERRSCSYTGEDPCGGWDFRPFYIRGTLHDETTEYVPRFVASYLVGEFPDLALSLARERDPSLPDMATCDPSDFQPPPPSTCPSGVGGCTDKRPDR